MKRFNDFRINLSIVSDATALTYSGMCWCEYVFVCVRARYRCNAVARVYIRNEPMINRIHEKRALQFQYWFDRT